MKRILDKLFISGMVQRVFHPPSTMDLLQLSMFAKLRPMMDMALLSNDVIVCLYIVSKYSKNIFLCLNTLYFQVTQVRTYENL